MDFKSLLISHFLMQSLADNRKEKRKEKRRNTQTESEMISFFRFSAHFYFDASLLRSYPTLNNILVFLQCIGNLGNLTSWESNTWKFS